MAHANVRRIGSVADSASHHKHRVLLLEDHEDLRVALAEFLNTFGMDVVAVEHGQAGLDVLGADCGSWCLALLDWRMPGVSGELFLRQLRAGASHAALPVVVCSGDGVTPAAVAQYGVAAIVTKPLDPDTLLALIDAECPATRCRLRRSI